MTHYKIGSILFGLAVSAFWSLFSPSSSPPPPKPQVNPEAQWVDSVFSTLGQDGKIGQLMMLRAYSNKDLAYQNTLIKTVKDLDIGGVCFFQGGPLRQADLTNRLQRASNIPMFVALDAEWGLGMRLDSTLSFPKQMTLGAVKDNAVIYGKGREIARQLKALGVHMNFAPDADVNNNSHNPVINARSFGENRESVAEKAYQYMKGMQDEGIIAFAKHFPGHGDTESDSHHTLPVISKKASDLEALELYPFRYLIERGVNGVMVAHLNVPALDPNPKSVSSLSKPIITGLLKNKMKFNGLVITDGLDMQGVTNYVPANRIAPQALIAGNDILLLPADAYSAVRSVREAIRKGEITQHELDEKVKKVLTWKYRAGLNVRPFIDKGNLAATLNSPAATDLIRRSYAEAFTLVSDPRQLVPLKRLDSLSLATVVIGDKQRVPFQDMLGKYAPFKHYNLPSAPTNAQTTDLLNKLKNHDLVFATIVNTSDYGKSYGMYMAAIELVNLIGNRHKTVLTLFSNPYSLAFFRNPEIFSAIAVGYQDSPYSQEAAAQCLMGGLPINGTLPVGVTTFPQGHGIVRKEITRVSFTTPEAAGVDTEELKRIDWMVADAIKKKAFPGAQIVAIRDGKVFFQKSYGDHKYGFSYRVEDDDVYDVASLTKIFATTLAVMKLEDQNRINYNRPVSQYLPDLERTNKMDLTIREMMTHQAGLIAYIPFHRILMGPGRAGNPYFAAHYNIDYPFTVSDGMYSRRDVPGRIFDSIIQSPLLQRGRYLYSDLGFMLLHKMVENVTNVPFQKYLRDNYYGRLGLSTTGFNPRERISIYRIPPTEVDNTFREQEVVGTVHDQTAALIGGIAGHAGLFSDALDLGILLQMLINNGTYGGEKYLSPQVINQFTSIQFPGNRRAAGFDKPLVNSPGSGPACPSASPRSYGHSGFTGTYAWADPDERLVYIFLSNRVYPDAGNNLLSQLSVRTNVHQVFYDAIHRARFSTAAYN